MKMMRYSLLVLFVFSPIFLFAQNYEARGDKAYRDGDYVEAEIQYNAALALLNSQKVNENSPEYLLLERKLVRTRTCLPLMREAENLMAAAEISRTEAAYGKAKQAYQEILLKNSEDRSARQKIIACDKSINTIRRERDDEALWAQVRHSKDIGSYEAYLKEFPDGLHSAESRQCILSIEDDHLWQLAASENTIDAYNSYLSDTKTGDHSSEARYAICIIYDDQAWEPLKDGHDERGLMAYISDTTNFCKQYLDKANAYLTIIRTRRYAETANADARQIVADLSSAQESVILDAETKRILEEKKALVDYEDFVDNPNVIAGIHYLARYSADVSIYRDRVSDMTARLMADNFNSQSGEADRDRAMKYAVSRETRNYIEDKYRTINKSRRAVKRRNAWEERWQLGLGLDLEYNKNLVWGPRLELKVGAAADFFNFSVGMKYLMWNPGDASDLLYSPKLGANQMPLYAVMKFNLSNRANSRGGFYLAAEGSYNINFNSVFKAPDSEVYSSSRIMYQGEKVSDPAIVYKNNITTGLRLGYNWRKFDLGLYGKYDVTPMFDAAYVSSVPGYAWDVVSDKANARFRYGISLIYYMIL